MPKKFLIGIGAAFFTVFILGIAAVVGINDLSTQPVLCSRSTQAQASVSSPPPFAPFAPVIQSVEQVDYPDTKPAVASAALPPSAPIIVTDADILQLADAVKLGRTSTGDVTKDVWAKETPIAQKLLQGMCDCDQRNWLKHFVKAGNEAISGSENFDESVQTLATLRRGDQALSVNH